MADTQFLTVQYSCGHSQTIEYRDIRELTCRPLTVHEVLEDLRKHGLCPTCSMRSMARSMDTLAASTRALADAAREFSLAAHEGRATPAEREGSER